MIMTLEVGAKAPEIKYITVDGDEESTLTSGKETWVIFIPFAFTGVCESELCDMRDNPNNYITDTRDAIIVSCDSSPAQKAWAESIGFKGSLVSDFNPHGKIAQSYDNFNDHLGCANRVSFLVGTDGKIAKVNAASELGKSRDLAQYA